MILPKQLTTVTTFSKVLAGILFITLPFVGFWLGMEYQKTVNETALLESSVISPPVQDLPDTKQVFVPSVLIANSGLYTNKIVKVHATAMPRDLACTQRDCGSGVACCNTCRGGLFLSNPSFAGGSSTKESITLVGENISCSGLDCDIKCTPLEDGETYLVTGKLVEKTNTSGKTYYELEYISHLPATTDICSDISRMAFRSKKRYEIGLGPDGLQMDYWGIHFDKDTFTWSYSDVSQSGTYTCNNNTITAILPNQTIIATFNNGVLLWEGKTYVGGVSPI